MAYSRVNFTLLYVLFINCILATLPENKVPIPGGGKIFSLLKTSRLALGLTHPPAGLVPEILFAV